MADGIGIPYKEIPQDYSLDNAKSDNLVVYENGNITSGQTVWDTFIEKTDYRKPCVVRLGFYYTLDDPSRYSPEHYEEIKDDFPVLYVMDLSYDGTTYTLYSIEDGIEYSPQFRYLKHFTEESPPISAIYTKREIYILVNDNEVTWEQIQRGLASSQIGDFIDHRTVYSKYTYANPTNRWGGGTAIARGSDNDTEPSVTEAKVAGFTLFLAGTSANQTLTLNSEYQYFYIKVVNTGDSTISMTIGNDSSTESANFCQIPTGTYYIWSTKEWPASSQAVGFSSNNGMSGNVYAYLCSTLIEAESHN